MLCLRVLENIDGPAPFVKRNLANLANFGGNLAKFWRNFGGNLHSGK